MFRRNKRIIVRHSVNWIRSDSSWKSRGSFFSPRRPAHLVRIRSSLWSRAIAGEAWSFRRSGRYLRSNSTRERRTGIADAVIEA